MPGFDVLITLPNVGTRIYSICCILSYLSRVTNAASPWSDELKDFAVGFPAMPYASVQDMGFPIDWQSHGFWK